MGKEDEGEKQCILCIYMTKVSLVFNSDQEKELKEQMDLSQVVPYRSTPFMHPKVQWCSENTNRTKGSFRQKTLKEES